MHRNKFWIRDGLLAASGGSRCFFAAAVMAAIAGWSATGRASTLYRDVAVPREKTTESWHSDFDYSFAEPTIIVGAPPDTPAAHIDPNLPTSPFAGVVSIFIDLAPSGDGFGGICSGALISPTHVLTAAHCVDVSGGLTSTLAPTGDGIADVPPEDVVVVFNNQPVLASTPILVGSAITLAADWHGFNNALAPEGAAVNDDLAVITLEAPAPAGVPIYPLDTEPFEFVTSVILAGYGRTGDGVTGFLPGPGDFFIKRLGANVASAFDVDDEAPNTAREIFFFDFDGPTLGTDSLVDGPTLGNDIEVTIAPGDSGGPSFIWTDGNGNDEIDVDELTIFGVNTFSIGGGGLPAAPLFGSIGGGILVSAYGPFIGAAVPEPSTMVLAVLGLTGLGFFARRRRAA